MRTIPQILCAVVSGYIQAGLLVAMTVFFGSTYRGTIRLSVVFVSFFATLVVISRTYSIYFCKWMESSLDATVIEYDTLTELKAIQSAIAVMPGVLVRSLIDGYVYSEGKRLDRYNPCVVHNSANEPSVDPRPIGFLVGLLAGTGLSVAVLMLLSKFSVSSFTKNKNLLGPSGICLSILLGLFLYHKIYSNFELINSHDFQRRHANSDEESARQKLMDGEDPDPALTERPGPLL